MSARMIETREPGWKAVAVALVGLLCLQACGTTDTRDPTTSAFLETTTARFDSTTSAPPETTTSAPPEATTSAPRQVSGEPLFVVGNWGTGTMPEGAVAGEMARRAEKSPPLAILTTGDNIYDVDPEFALMPYDWAYAAGVEFWITWGEEDAASPDRIDAVEANFESPARWQALTWGDVQVVILDTTQADSPAQRAFLEESMAAGTLPTLVVLHDSPFTCSATDPNAPPLDGLLGLLDDDVVLVVSGHYGNYQHFSMDEIEYVVSGGGGNTIDEIGSCAADQPPLLSGQAIHHFLIITQEATLLEIEAVNVTGSVIDEISVSIG